MTTRLRTLLEYLRAGRRPPTGPLTTAEQKIADLRRAESEWAEHEHNPKAR
jgi:hypothetical protein